jgi:hypothetical protein
VALASTSFANPAFSYLAVVLVSVLSGVQLGRAVGPRLMSGCGPGSRATCSAALFGALEAYPPVGTTPRVPGEELVAGYRVFMK